MRILDRPSASRATVDKNLTAMRPHRQHLRAYCNAPVQDAIVDPRYDWVIGRHDAVHFADLGGKWAPSATYGTEVENIMARLRAA